MHHLSEQVAMDLARGLRGRGDTQGLGSHLEGCTECKAENAFWARLQAMAIGEAAYSAPEDVVRLAKVEFTARQGFAPEKWALASLLFDSLAQPLPAGVRSGAAVARQVVYEAEGLTLDLRFDRAASLGMVLAVGQMLDNRAPRGRLGEAQVLLWTEEGQLVATTLANSHGEFQLEIAPQNNLRLTARVGSRRVQVPLTNF